MLQVKQGIAKEYEPAFKEASSIIFSMKDYAGHELHRCIEQKGTSLLLVKQETLEDHTMGCRQSKKDKEWRV